MLSTPHGSRLYGTDHENSDHDRFEVYGWIKKRTTQKMYGIDDVVTTSLDSFLKNCDRGSPQFLEAMFSQKATIDRIPYIRESYTPDLAWMRLTYTRVIKALWFEATDDKLIKLRRHALRLRLNLREAMECGRFNPTLTPDQVALITEQAGTLKELPEIL